MLKFRTPAPQVEKYHCFRLCIAFECTPQNQDPIISIKLARDFLGILAIATLRDFGIFRNLLSIN